MSIERTPRTALIRTLCERAAVHPRIVQAVTDAVRVVLPGVMEELVWDAVPQGEQLRLYKPKIEKRRERTQRILSALAAGERTADIAKRERMSESGVRRIYQRLGGTSPP